MASPASGLNQNQTQSWANQFQNTMRGRGFDPRQLGFNAQPVTQPQSTPRPPAGGGFSAYRPTPQQSGGDFSAYRPATPPPTSAPQQRQPSFQFRATDFAGNTYDNPAALAAQQGAMAQALNQQRAQQVQSGNFGPLNPMAAYQQAQNMVQGGWTNPFAQQPAAPTYQQWNDRGMGPPLLAAGYKWGPDGQAQPIQPPSQGAPYGQPNGGMGGGPGIMASPQQDSNIAKGYARYGINTQDPRFRQFADQYAKQEVANRRGTEPGGAYDTATVAKAFLSKQAAPIQPPSQGTPYGQPGGGRLEDTNPALWNESQWSEYETRQRNSGLSDSGGYYRDRQGNVRYSGGLSGPGPIITPQTRRDQYGFWRDNPAPQTPAPPPPPPPRQANPNTPTFGVYPPGTVSSPDSPVPAPIRPAPQGQAQPIQPPSQGTLYGQFIDRDGDGIDDHYQSRRRPPRREGFERDAVGMPILRAPQVWTNPSDPEWLKRELQSKPDTRPVVWDEANRRYIKNPYLAGGPARPDAAAPLQRYEPGFAFHGGRRLYSNLIY